MTEIVTIYTVYESQQCTDVVDVTPEVDVAAAESADNWVTAETTEVPMA